MSEFSQDLNVNTYIKYPGRWLRITVFLVVTSPYTAVYDEIRHKNGPYFAVILVTVNRYRIQHRILYRIRSYAYRILITNGRKPPTWIPVKIRCVNGPYMTVYGRICAVYVPYFSTRVFTWYSFVFIAKLIRWESVTISMPILKYSPMHYILKTYTSYCWL